MARQTKLQPGFSRLPVWSRGRRLLENAQLQTFSQRVQHRQARLGSPQAARAREGAQWRERRRRHFLSPLTALSRAGAVRGHLRHRPLRWKWRQRPAPSLFVPLSACGHLHARALRGGKPCVTPASPHRLCGEVGSDLQTESGQRIPQVQPLTAISVISIPIFFTMAIDF